MDDIRKILAVYLEDADTYGTHGWKDVILDIYVAATEAVHPLFDPDTMRALQYMYEVVFYTVCSGCGDEKAWNWFDGFARAIVHGGEPIPPPSFLMLCGQRGSCGSSGSRGSCGSSH